MLTMISEIPMQMCVYLYFIYYAKAFEKLRHEELVELPDKIGKYIRIFWEGHYNIPETPADR